MKTIYLEDVQKDVIKKLEEQNKEMLEWLKIVLENEGKIYDDSTYQELVEFYENIIEKNKDSCNENIK